MTGGVEMPTSMSLVDLCAGLVVVGAVCYGTSQEWKSHSSSEDGRQRARVATDKWAATSYATWSVVEKLDSDQCSGA